MKDPEMAVHRRATSQSRSGRGLVRRTLLRAVTPKEPIPVIAAIVFGLLGIATIGAVWSLLSYGGFFDPFFLPTPSSVGRAMYDLFAYNGFFTDVWASTRRVMLGFLISAVLAVPLGIGMGSYRVTQALFEPVIAAVRYMPASAFVPLFIIWFGIAENAKIAVIFFGIFFPITLMIADVSANVPKELINMAYTLGASRFQVFWKVLVPACWPGVFDALRIGIGWGWTYLIVAELVAANTGIGHVIIASSRFLQTNNIMAAILTIGVLGLVTDFCFRSAYRFLFPYAERISR